MQEQNNPIQVTDEQSLEQLKQETAERGRAGAEAAGVTHLELETPEVLAGETPKTAMANGVEVMALKDVETPDGVKPFADGNIVGVFDPSAEEKTIDERLGQPDEFITMALAKIGVKAPDAWKTGLHPMWIDKSVDIKQRIFHINQQLRLFIAECAVEHSSTIQPRATIVDGVSVEDWYKIISGGVIKYIGDLMIESEERKAKEAAQATESAK